MALRSAAALRRQPMLLSIERELAELRKLTEQVDPSTGGGINLDDTLLNSEEFGVVGGYLVAESKGQGAEYMKNARQRRIIERVLEKMPALGPTQQAEDPWR